MFYKRITCLVIKSSIQDGNSTGYPFVNKLCVRKSRVFLFHNFVSCTGTAQETAYSGLVRMCFLEILRGKLAAKMNPLAHAFRFDRCAQCWLVVGLTL